MSFNQDTQFIRMSNDDDPAHLIQLMMDYWGLLKGNPPLLCISVVGGGKSLSLRGAVKENFCKVSRVYSACKLSTHIGFDQSSTYVQCMAANIRP